MDSEREPAERPPVRELGRRAAGKGRYIYVAGAIALTEPGPAATGIVVADRQGRMLAQRAQYLGHATRSEAAARALLGALRLAATSRLDAPVFRLDDAELASALGEDRPLPGKAAPLTGQIQEALAALPEARIEVIPASTNLARAAALTPLVDWLPERTRRAGALRVRVVGDGEYEVESERQPGQVYHVTFRPTGRNGDVIACECSDFLYRGIPCKHLLAVARQAGALNRLFYPPSEQRAS